MRNNLFKRVISLVIALMMIMSGTQVFFASTHGFDEGDITLDKTATHMGGNTYEIQLSVTGKDIDTGKEVDVILVIDNSASMFNSKYNNETLGEITRKAAKAFVDGVLTPANDSSGNVRVAVVRYGEQANARIFSDSSGSWSSNWSNGLDLTDKDVYTSNNTAARNAIDKATETTTNEGTNTEGGFLMAKKVAEAKRDEAESIVIFMTDGMPTYKYTGTGSNTGNDGSGSQTSRDEFNEAIKAAQDLDTYIGQGGEIYTIALLNNVLNTSNQAKLAANLLSMNPKTYDWYLNTQNIITRVGYDRWEPTDVYANAYYSIHAGDNAADKMETIYKTLAGTINALANGYVTDVIDSNFELTAESLDDLEKKGVEITVNEDGTTTLVFRNVSASGEINYLHAFDVVAKPGIYGTGFTNEEAYYTFKLFGEDVEKSKEFLKPIVPIDPIANDDSYTTYQDQVLTVSNINDGILENDDPVKIEAGGYVVSELVVEDGYIATIPTLEGGTVVLAADGTFTYTPPAGFTGDDYFNYKNMASVTGDGPLADDYESNLAEVTITVLPVGTDKILYHIKHLVQESNEVLKQISDIGSEGDVITAYAEGFPNYVLAPEQSNMQQMTLEAEGNNTIIFWYVADIPEPNKVPYTVQYLDKDTEEKLIPDKTGFGYPDEEVTEDAVSIDGYTPEVDSQTFVIDDENILIIFWYVADDDPEGVKYYITINHYKDSVKEANLHKTEEKTRTVTSGSSITVKGEEYKINISGYKYKSSDPKQMKIPDLTTTSTAIEYVFNLLYTEDTGGGGGGGGGGGNPPVVIEDPEVPLAELEKTDHFAYIIGYPEGDVRPLNNITREEVAMIFYRLLTDESRDALLSDVNPFTDMESGRWSNRAISTLYNADIISGYPDGTFKPSAPITRAEFATIAAKFDDLDLENESAFTDIIGHWAEDYITSSENKGWIKGYPDMTFKPDQDITRAEAMTLINNVLERAVPAENIHPDAIFWPDNPETEWYYEAVMEATNSHDYVYEEDGDELWTGMKPNKVWP